MQLDQKLLEAVQTFLGKSDKLPGCQSIDLGLGDPPSETPRRLETKIALDLPPFHGQVKYVADIGRSDKRRRDVGKRTKSSPPKTGHHSRRGRGRFNKQDR